MVWLVLVWSGLVRKGPVWPSLGGLEVPGGLESLRGLGGLGRSWRSGRSGGLGSLGDLEGLGGLESL